MSGLRWAIASFAGIVTLAACVRIAAAEPEAPEDTASETKAPVPGPVRPGFEILATAGYGASTADVLGVEMSPYGASFGLDVGYALRSGFRVGGSVVYGLGRTTTQRRASRFGDDIDLEIDASSLNVGASVAYDVPLYFLALRSSLMFGATFMRWDLGVPSSSVFSGGTTSPSAGFVLAPGLALLWPRRVFEWGVGFDYYVQANGAIPPGFSGKLLVGAKF